MMMMDMADSQLWLPPLNRHTNYTIKFTAVQSHLPFKDSSPPSPSPSTEQKNNNPSPRFKLRFQATVDFYSDSRSSPAFRGLNYLTGETFISCRGLMYCSTARAKKLLKNMLSDFGINFPLYHVLFVQKPYKRRYSHCTEKVWIRGFQNFLRLISKKYLGKEITIPLLLKIDKAIIVPEGVHKRWSRWYNLSKQLDPDFENKYKKAISRPRSYHWELFCEEDMNFDQISTAIFKEVKKSDNNNTINTTTGINNNSSSNGEDDDCSICLEDLSDGKKGFIKSLPCAHTFHLHCIRYWLHVNQVCPLCRATLPLISNGSKLSLI